MRLAYLIACKLSLRGEWPSGLYSLRQVTEDKLGRVRSNFGSVTPIFAPMKTSGSPVVTGSVYVVVLSGQSKSETTICIESNSNE